MNSPVVTDHASIEFGRTLATTFSKRKFDIVALSYSLVLTPWPYQRLAKAAEKPLRAGI